MKIEVITTGGTIDKIYFDALSEYHIGEPVIETLLQKMGVAFEFKVTPLMRKDSLELDDNDRLAIQAAVRGSKADKILITHGTDTMANTAIVLQELEGKCIVLTGALQPAAFSNTDAIFNIGCAIGALQSKENGVYIAMNGVVFDALKVRKNRDKNRFEASP
ncbi:MAG: asparaginase domain-containing protein [Pseudomonadales bacterium]